MTRAHHMKRPTIRQVHVRHVERRAWRAIADRLGTAPRGGGVIACHRDPGEPAAVLLHVNSGGNAVAVTDALTEAGYTVEQTSYDPWARGNYGVQLRVAPTAPPRVHAEGRDGA